MGACVADFGPNQEARAAFFFTHRHQFDTSASGALLRGGVVKKQVSRFFAVIIDAPVAIDANHAHRGAPDLRPAVSDAALRRQTRAILGKFLRGGGLGVPFDLAGRGDSEGEK